MRCATHGVLLLMVASVCCATPTPDTGKQPSAVAAVYDGGSTEDAAGSSPRRNHAEEPACFPPGSQTQHTPVSYNFYNGAILGLYQDPNDANSSDTLTNQGGPIIGSADIELIFWGSAWNTANNPSSANITAAVQKILASPYLSGMAFYGFQHLNFRGAMTLPDNPTNGFNCQDTVGNRIWDLIDDGVFPEPDDDGGRILYMVFMPPGVNPANPAQGAHCNADDRDIFEVDHAWVAWAGYQSLNGITATFAHELVEAISDPEPNNENAWGLNRSLNCGNEIGDVCWHIFDFLNGVQVPAYFLPNLGCVIPFPPPPTATFLYPPFGRPRGNDSIRIDGTNFDTGGSTQVSFGGVPALSVNCPSSTQCFATSPPGNGSVPVTVTVNRFTTSPLNFNYVPSVTGIEPSHGSVGDTVTIHGIGFIANGTGISFGPYQVPVQDVYCVTSGDCVVKVPPGTGVEDVLVTVGGETSTAWANDRFTYDRPTITKISRRSGPISGGTSVSITGTGFDPDHLKTGSMKGRFGGVYADYLLCETSTQCTIHSPKVADPGTVDIVLSVFGTETAKSPADLFTYNALPTIADLSCFQFTCGVILDGEAPDGGAWITLTLSDPNAVSLPTSVFIPAGQAGVTFEYSFLPIAQSEKVTVTARYQNSSLSTTIDVYAWAPISLFMDAEHLNNGESTKGTVTLNTKAPAGGAKIALASDNTALPVPGVVIVPAGANSATFTVTSQYIGNKPDAANITAKYNGGSTSARVLLGRQPPPPPPHCHGIECQ